MTNIRDIARKAGTSVSTVSRALNKSGYVSADVRKKVEAVARELQYRPNASARQMGGAKSRMIGILVPGLDVPFFGIMAHNLEQHLFQRGYHSFICNTAESSENEIKYVDMLLSNKIDGAIVASAHSDGIAVDRLTKAGVPIVAIDRPAEGRSLPLVSVDNFAGGKMMADHIIGLGHKKIGVVGSPNHSYTVKQRLDGIEATIASNELIDPIVAMGNVHSLEACYALARTLLESNPEITAILGLSDVAAVGAIHAARDLEKDVPRDISVIGFDNTPESRFIKPRLTTVAQPMEDLTKVAAELIVDLVESKEEAASSVQTLPLKLIERESTSKAALQA